MSGVCMMKKGRAVRCSECDEKAKNIEDEYCAHCGEQVVMRWDADRDCLWGEQK